MDYFSRSSSWDVTDVPRPLRSIARRGHGFEPWIWMSGLGYTWPAQTCKNNLWNMKLMSVTSKDPKVLVPEQMALSEKFKTESCHWDMVQSYGILTRIGKGSTGVTAGKLLQHCIAQINDFCDHIGQQLCVFKIGVTSNPLCRFCAYLEKGFTAMFVLAVSNNVDHIHMLEAACISKFAKNIGCKNAVNSGGEGALNCMDTEPPFFLYVTGGRADQGRWVGWCCSVAQSASLGVASLLTNFCLWSKRKNWWPRGVLIVGKFANRM